jgi:hypothetical protein
VEEDALIQGLLDAAEQFIYNATGVHYGASNQLAVLLQQVLVCEWYMNREATGRTGTIKPIVQSILRQLKYAEIAADGGEVE